MKFFFLLNLRVSLSLVGFAVFAMVSPIIINAQTPPCAANWWTRCCKCEKCLVVDPLPSFGYCRECTLLCPDCRKELGDLNKAWEDLRNKNRVLLERMKVYQNEANRHNSRLTDALVKTYGQESGGWNKPSTWNLSGFNSSVGRFTVAAANVVSDFGGGLGVGLLFNTLSTIQSVNALELEGNISQTIIDILTDEEIIEIFTDAEINGAARKLMDAFKRRQLEPPINLFNQQVRLRHREMVNKFAKGVNVVANLYGLITAGADLISNLTDIYDNYKARERSEAEREKLQDAIVKNADLMLCIKETQDSLKNGGLGFKKNLYVNFYAVKMLLGFFLSKISYKDLSYSVINQHSENSSYWEIDTIIIKSAITQLKKQDALLKTMITDFFEKVIPPLVPWILNRQEELKAPDQLKLLQMAKKHLNKLMTDGRQIKNLSELITQNLGSAVTGYEIDYMTDNSNNFEIISRADSATGSIDKWKTTPNEKIKGEFGRVNMNFPAGVDWSVDFYTLENNYVTNRSIFSKHKMFHDLTPGNYNITLNHVKIENVPVEKGKEVRLEAGILNIITREPWQLYNESKEKYYTSGIKPVKFALPVGRYILNFEGKDYRVVIKDRATVKFERKLSEN